MPYIFRRYFLFSRKYVAAFVLGDSFLVSYKAYMISTEKMAETR